MEQNFCRVTGNHTGSVHTLELVIFPSEGQGLRQTDLHCLHEH